MLRSLTRPLAGLALVLTTTLLGCGAGKDTAKWIPSDAAVLRCTVAGPNLRLPPLFDEIPTPMVPTGMLARTMDPIALDELGYERDQPVCAAMFTPEAAELERAQQELAEFDELQRTVATSLRSLGRCRCTYAAALDAAGLISGCADKPTDDSCEADGAQIEALAQTLAPLRSKLATTEVPRVHWRMVGPTDRLGRFQARYEQLIARHPGGSEVYLRQTPLPPRHGMQLVANLLSLDGVVAVVTQDSGRSLLVVRELDGLLVLDYFGYPDWSGRLDPQLQSLLSYLDDAQLDRYRRALAAPVQAREPMLAPADGYLIELDHAGLERVDQAALISATFAGVGYDDSHELRERPPLYVDRIALQVPFGTEGTAMRARLRLGEEGRRWIAGVAGVPLVDGLDTLGADEVEPRYAATRRGVEQMFLLRGQAIEQLLFAGPTGLPKILRAVEDAAPGSVTGTIDDWQADLPSGPLPGNFPSRLGSKLIRERLSIYPHRLSGKLASGGREIALELKRR